MTSVLTTDYVPQTRPYSQNELRDMREKLYSKLNLSNILASHPKCKHFYFVRKNSRKYNNIKEENNPDSGNCSVCWKLNNTPKDLYDKAEELVYLFEREFKEPRYDLTYDSFDIENCYYNWIYERDNRDSRDNRDRRYRRKRYD